MAHCDFCHGDKSGEENRLPIYCGECSTARRALASEYFGGPPQPEDFEGEYLLPRRTSLTSGRTYTIHVRYRYAGRLTPLPIDDTEE